MKINRFEEIEVWQLARLLVKNIYLVTNDKLNFKDFNLANQTQRAAVSIMGNIAEGYERKTKKEFIQFLFISKGSSGELRSHLYIALDLGYISKEKFSELYKNTEIISKSLTGFIKYLNNYNLPI